ncbi:MAG: hypothetical protein ICV60_05720 [Pyrinomonadaceae bacterium]|nr:hypothetical protein [Pyrinomonadaceae bacterium]
MAVETHMNNGTGANGVIMLLAFVSGLSVSGILLSLLATVAVGLMGKAVDGLIRWGVATYTNHWRKKYLQMEARAEDAERRLHALQGKTDGV